MDERQSDTPILTPFLYGGIAFLGMLIVGVPSVAIPALGILGPPVLIFAIIRWLNHRDEPRRTKHPADAP